MTVGVKVLVCEGVIVGVGVKDNAAIAFCASAVRATDVVVAITSRVGAMVRVKVKVGGTVAVSVGV